MKKILTTLKISSLIIFSFFIFSNVAYMASPKDAVCEGVGVLNSGGTGCTDPPNTPTVNDTIAKGLNIFTAVVGVIAVVMIIVGGVKYITSQGDAGKVGEAKNTILYAAVGLVIVALAQVIVHFVLNKFTK